MIDFDSLDLIDLHREPPPCEKTVRGSLRRFAQNNASLFI
jgi:hypothetical protein